MQTEDQIKIEAARKYIEEETKRRIGEFGQALDALAKQHNVEVSARPVISDDGRLGAQIVIRPL